MRFLLAVSIFTMLYADDARIPVVVELFTSEGCSSCPPADELLARLERTQPVNNVRIIALEEHVDYWNQLGWLDRFSSPLFRGRQNDYARVFNTDNIYTPQMVVNGLAALVGDGGANAQEAIRKAAVRPDVTVRLAPERNRGDAYAVDIAVQLRNERAKTSAPADVYLALTENRLVSQVLAGENAGRQLRHSAVVRSFSAIGKLDARAAVGMDLKPTLKIPTQWNRRNLRAVVFVQDEKTQRITGAGTADLP
jgi:hypothetical protein